MRSTQTESQLAALDDDGNPHRPDESDAQDDPLSMIRRAIDAMTRTTPSRPFAWLGVGLGIGLFAGVLLARRN